MADKACRRSAAVWSIRCDKPRGSAMQKQRARCLTVTGSGYRRIGITGNDTGRPGGASWPTREPQSGEVTARAVRS